MRSAELMDCYAAYWRTRRERGQEQPSAESLILLHDFLEYLHCHLTVQELQAVFHPVEHG